MDTYRRKLDMFEIKLNICQINARGVWLKQILSFFFLKICYPLTPVSSMHGLEFFWNFGFCSWNNELKLTASIKRIRRVHGAITNGSKQLFHNGIANRKNICFAVEAMTVWYWLNFGSRITMATLLCHAISCFLINFGHCAEKKKFRLPLIDSPISGLQKKT